MSKVIDILHNDRAPFASFELVPPLKGSDVSRLYDSIDPLICEIRVTYLLMNFLPFMITMPLKAASTF